LIAVLFVLERLLPCRASWDALRDPQLAHDVAHGIVQNELGTRLGEVALAALLAWSGPGADHAAALWPSTWPFAAQVILVVFLADGLEYWRHRFLHEVPWLWPIHALHHSAGRMHVLKGGRLHLLDLLLRYVVVFAPLIAVGIPRPLVLWYTVALLIIGPISHGNLALRFPGWVHWVLVTPPEHHLHHACDLRLAMGNYAPVFPLWDILFGTYRHPDTHPLGDVGIEHDPVPATFLRQCLTPLLLWRRLGSFDVPAAAAGASLDVHAPR
jgi:sterol desaturase/sphingolipid hydroxylase (fatty acid hydroxylase superfamily)